jgi:hypothetical protein
LNYFSHARVAAEVDGDAAFVLGAMLPDFAHMMGQRICELTHPGLRSGERHHRKTDEAFHRCRAFQTLLREGVAVLAAAGLSRGPARAATHVGLELLFDGALVGDPRSDAPYLCALDAAPELEPSITWSGPDGTLRWQRLQARLRMNGLPYALRDPTRVTERLARAIDARPRLRLEPHERAPVERWISSVRTRVDRAAPQLLAETLGEIG